MSDEISTKLDLNEYFNEEWHENVIGAIDLAMSTGRIDPRQYERLVDYVIDYNIERTLDEVILPNLVKTLPKRFDWNKDFKVVFTEFKDIIDSCDVCPTFTKYKATVKLGADNFVKNYILSMKEYVNSYYPTLFVEFTPLKTKNLYRLTIKNTALES